MANVKGASETNLNTVVFVDGPFRSVQAAQASVASLNGIEIAERGGLYEVTASLPSHLEVAVQEVAGCLRGSGASKPKSSGGSNSGSGSQAYSF